METKDIINEVVNNGCKVYDYGTEMYDKIDSLDENEYSLLQDELEKACMYIEYRCADEEYVVF